MSEEKSSPNKIITGIKFKLNLDKDTNQKLNAYFDEYGKAINFAVNVINKELDPSKLVFAGKIKKDSEGKIIKDENGKKVYEYPGRLCSCGNQIRYYDKGNPLCENCYKTKYTENGIRKRMYSAKRRKAEYNINIKNATNKISKTHFNYAIREAFILNKSIKKQKKERIRRLINEKRKLNQFIDMRDGKNILVPKKEGQRAERYVSLFLKKEFEEHPENFRGYTMSMINKKIQILDRNIKREEKSLNERESINFKARRIMLDKSVKFGDNNEVYCTISKDLPKKYILDLPIKEKKLNWLKERINLLKSQKPKYCYLLRKDGEFFLQYTLETISELKSDYKGAIGIDRGISHIAVCTFVSNDGGINPPKFFSSSEIVRLKNLQKERDKFLRGKHNKIRKKGNMRNIENKISLILHEYSKQIVKMAQDKNAFIVFEKLEKIKKSRIKMPKSQQYKLSLFVFKKLSDFVDYKAKREGIKVEYVPPENTSKFCSHCGSINTQRPFNGNYSLFKCNKCGVQLNSDYNASVNIAKKGLKISTF